ncbi:hypothetical protein Ciccas_008272 [Cichlidogyrus casuarinus]|uniref:Uncharacterized protein n=1 Tax=Cichlidogyrus casuarinus TaxID=1844966 RepID=A0ABD2Q0F9_9PLAT
MREIRLRSRLVEQVKHNKSDNCRELKEAFSKGHGKMRNKWEAIFLILWSVDECTEKTYTHLGHLFDLMTFLNSAIGILFYASTSAQYRSTFKEMFCKRRFNCTNNCQCICNSGKRELTRDHSSECFVHQAPPNPHVSEPTPPDMLINTTI